MRRRIRALMRLVSLAATGYGMWRVWSVDRRLFLAIVATMIAAAVGAACRDPAGPRAEVSDEDVQRGVEIARQIRQDARRECAEYQEGLRGGGNG
jgi:hypothetical protein